VAVAAFEVPIRARLMPPAGSIMIRKMASPQTRDAVVRCAVAQMAQALPQILTGTGCFEPATMERIDHAVAHSVAPMVAKTAGHNRAADRHPAMMAVSVCEFQFAVLVVIVRSFWMGFPAVSGRGRRAAPMRMRPLSATALDKTSLRMTPREGTILPH
jgi:hypothetical protein